MVQNYNALKKFPSASGWFILGYDWLKTHSPMEVDWDAKCMVVHDNGWQVRLQGVRPMDVQCRAISTIQCCNLLKQSSITQVIQVYAILTDDCSTNDEEVPAAVVCILEQFAAVFSEPTGLPPRRDCDHKIELIPGAQPVSMRPYRHSPELKTEIERQVQEMLDSGIIQPSKSSFSSPVILVKKKDGTWRMCIDFRRLNSLTRPTKFPIPIIDELLEELAGASWFSKLDLCAGYLQIRLAEGEEFKTAFQTHSGQFEYKVMTFGLSGAPATFNSAMNITLKPCLRRCVMVFFDDILVYSQSLEQHVKDLTEVLQLLQHD